MPNRLKILATETLTTSYTDVYVTGASSGGFTAANARETTPDMSDLSVIQAMVGSIILCEKNNAVATVDIRVIPRGETPADGHLIFEAMNIGANKTKIISPGITMSFEDRIQAKASTVHVNIFVFGAESN